MLPDPSLLKIEPEINNKTLHKNDPKYTMLPGNAKKEQFRQNWASKVFKQVFSSRLRIQEEEEEEIANGQFEPVVRILELEGGKEKSNIFISVLRKGHITTKTSIKQTIKKQQN